MKASHHLTVLFLTIALIYSCFISAQKNKSTPLDTALEANSEKWKVKLHKGFGMGKPEFGPFTTLNIDKVDSAVLRKKTKEGSSADVDISGDAWDWDFSKYQMVEKRKAYRMLVSKDADTSESLFSIYTISHDKKLTFLGEIMSKNDDGKNQRLGFKKNVSGIIATPTDSPPLRFFIEDTSAIAEGPAGFPGGSTTLTRAYIIAANDSLFTEPIMQYFGRPGSKFSLQWQQGVFITTAQGNHIAALKFGAAGDLSNPFYVWIRKDLQPSYQHAIASLFALLMVVKAS
jgi:hypothetical protein